MKKLFHYFLLAAIMIAALYILAQAGQEFLQTVPDRARWRQAHGKMGLTVIELALFCIVVTAVCWRLWHGLIIHQGEASKDGASPLRQMALETALAKLLAAFLSGVFSGILPAANLLGDLFSARTCAWCCS